MSDTVVVVAGGSAPGARGREAIPRGATVIAADGGADHARALGLEIDLAIGDFDSGSPEGARRVERQPAEKDATDLELALRAALELEPRRILVVGGIEGRLDHLLGELLGLALPELAGVEVDAVLGDAVCHVVRGTRSLAGKAGDLISLFALGGPAEGVATEGLAYPLHNETLLPGSSRGISNVFAGAEARVTVERGVLLAVRP